MWRWSFSGVCEFCNNFEPRIAFQDSNLNPRTGYTLTCYEYLASAPFTARVKFQVLYTPQRTPWRTLMRERERERERNEDVSLHITIFSVFDVLLRPVSLLEVNWITFRNTRLFDHISATRGANTRHITELWFFFFVFSLESRIRKNGRTVHRLQICS
jgi:hypothetical protein